jgi:hypothetical protein
MIGVAKDPKARLKELQVGCPDELRLLGVVEGEEDTEESIHALLAEHRIRGEWFRPATDVFEIIDMMTNDNTETWRRFVLRRMQRSRRATMRIEAPRELIERYIELREQLAVRRAQTCQSLD